MKIDRMIDRLLTGLVLAAGAMLFAAASGAQVPAAHKTQNVIVVMMDGMRWQEVFQGADPKLIKTLGPDWLGDPKVMAAEAQQQYGRSTPAEARQALMPFLWSVMAAQGQIFGNRDLGSDSHVTNGLNFSYPGYAEISRESPTRVSTRTTMCRIRIRRCFCGSTPSRTSRARSRRSARGERSTEFSTRSTAASL